MNDEIYIINGIEYTREECLAHYGVLGMKWGRRKARETSSSNPKRKKMSTIDKIKNRIKNNKDKKERLKKAYEQSLSADHKEATKLKTKDTKQLSNDELRKLTNRMQLEKQYKELRSSEIKSQRTYMDEIKEAIMDDYVYPYARDYATKKMQEVISEAYKKKE